MGWLGIFLTGKKKKWSNKCKKFKWSKNVIGETVTIPKKLSRNVRDVKESTNMHNSCLRMINNSSYCLQVKKISRKGPKIGSSFFTGMAKEAKIGRTPILNHGLRTSPRSEKIMS